MSLGYENQGYLTRHSVKFKIKILLGKIRYFELNHVLEISPIVDK